MAIAQKWCIGGHPKGFEVHKLNRQSFQFLVANNKVGHFIDGLKYRAWPDFICHFHLFNGRFAKLLKNESDRQADEESKD